MKKDRTSPDNDQCPCGSTLTYEACCGRWHHGPDRLMAPDAESLMRSRYSAFVMDDLPYLLDTWHPDTRPPELEPNPRGMKWLGLTIKRHTVEDGEHATVEFVARNRLAGRAVRLHEESRFVREDGRWLYVDGEMKSTR